MPGFLESVKENKIKGPTQKGFCQEKWDEAWEHFKSEASNKDKSLYEAGIVIFGLLEEVREALSFLYKEKCPEINNEKILMAYISLSNRDRYVLSKGGFGNGKYIHSATTSNNFVGNEITLQEVSDGAVDGLEKAIFFCKARINRSEEVKKGNRPEDELVFINRESYLSQIYNIYESYWHAILWSDFDFIKKDRGNKVYLVRQPMNKAQIGFCVSQIRKSRLAAQSASAASSARVRDIYSKDKYVSFIKSGRKKKLACLSINRADDKIKYVNADWQVKKLFLSDSFGSDVLESEYDNGFSLNDALEVFRNLIILSYVFSGKYPENDGFSNIKKLLEFCPRVDGNQLCRAIVRSSGFDEFKVKKILDFLEYTASHKQDLWCHPIIALSDNKYALLTSSLLTPVITRVVEHWLVSLGIDLRDKGLVYEAGIVDGVNDAISRNSEVGDFDRASCGVIKIGGTEEEIDFILRIGNVILIGEAKSIVTTDSPVSNYRTIEKLEGAAKQVKRKANFVESNFEIVCERLKWKFEASSEYSFVKFILNSGRMYVGFDIDGVPVCDEKILIKYFSESEIPIISVLDKGASEPRHLAWVKLYNGFDEMIRNVDLYLRNPPQIFKGRDIFGHKDILVPSINSGSCEISFQRIVSRDLAVKDIVGMVCHFPVSVVEDYEEAINELDYII